MKLRVGVAIGIACWSVQILAADPSTMVLSSDKDKVSYSIGMDLGQNFKSQAIDINPALIARGMEDAIGNKPPLIDQKQREETLQNFQKQLHAKQESEFKQASVKNKEAGEALIAANKNKPGFVTLPSGLQYKVVETGTGQTPKEADTVTVDYEGRLIDGTIFDSSYKRGKPVTFPVADVIRGWKEALMLMKAGSTWEVVIPPQLAYGERGMVGSIGPNSTLLFKIKLISVSNSAKSKG